MFFIQLQSNIFLKRFNLLLNLIMKYVLHTSNSWYKPVSSSNIYEWS